MSIALAYIAQYIGAELVLNASLSTENIEQILPLDLASSQDLSFLANEKYIASLLSTQACCVIVSQAHIDKVPCHALVMDNPYLGLAKAAQLFEKSIEHPVGIHLSAVVDSSAHVEATASIGANTVVGKNCRISRGVVIEPNCTIGEGVVIGADSHIYPNVSFYHGVVIGEKCIIHSGVVIGGDGFGLAKQKDSWIKVPQLGSVEIGNGVEIGCNTTIDRGSLANTQIHDNVKIDNQVHLAHNVIVSENTAIVAQVGISGSTKIGKNCILAGKAGAVGHIEIADNVVATARTTLTKSLKNSGVYSSTIPARPQKEWARTSCSSDEVG